MRSRLCRGRAGQRVKIGRYKRRLVRSLGSQYPGGWIIDRPIDGLLYWNIDAMRPDPPKEQP